ncbi:hypothetical protein COLO4_28661 [Corchorus olitorius]|uniref:Uncharacterized protein n=1 Tax=Corchorus olitorius TaxID=93759 RepID=A0A1R3HIW8_9ROSI|nr:hypothetical protein COLO4_28661 [Corchorus olitorius]
MFSSSQFDGTSSFSGGGLMPSLPSHLANSTPSPAKRWRAAYQTESESTVDDPVKYDVYSSISNSELAAAFSERKRRERRTVRGFGIRITQSKEGSDSWVDDPITHHIAGLYINKEEEGQPVSRAGAWLVLCLEMAASSRTVMCCLETMLLVTLLRHNWDKLKSMLSFQLKLEVGNPFELYGLC